MPPWCSWAASSAWSPWLLSFPPLSVYDVLHLQVLNVTLEEGENVVLEDLGGLEPSILANKSRLMRGLVVKSSSNLISIHFTNQKQPRPGSLLVRYRGEAYLRMLPCAGTDSHRESLTSSSFAKLAIDKSKQCLGSDFSSVPHGY